MKIKKQKRISKKYEQKFEPIEGVRISFITMTV
jgi:hypothetical protein